MCCWCIKTDSCVSWLFGACCQTPSGFFSTWKSSHLSYMNHFLPAALNQTAALRFPGFTFWALSKNPVYMKLQQLWKLDSLFYSHCCTNLIWHVWVKTQSLNCKMQQNEPPLSLHVGTCGKYTCFGKCGFMEPSALWRTFLQTSEHRLDRLQQQSAWTRASAVGVIGCRDEQSITEVHVLWPLLLLWLLQTCIHDCVFAVSMTQHEEAVTWQTAVWMRSAHSANCLLMISVLYK